MRSPRIRHLVEPSMSVAGRNLTITNEVRTIMTTTALSACAPRQRGLERLVSRLAVSMLHWSSRRTRALQLSHARMVLLRDNERAIARSADSARLR
ncbi:hypothetical protein ACFPJ4_06780 [Lysinimonas soli]|uniref:Uncharacterized protein n=1 Tax=Lysinimonas soli TaxID=1074233 RepID=A0ABW0NNK5_9MICO